MGGGGGGWEDGREALLHSAHSLVLPVPPLPSPMTEHFVPYLQTDGTDSGCLYACIPVYVQTPVLPHPTPAAHSLACPPHHTLQQPPAFPFYCALPCLPLPLPCTAFCPLCALVALYLHCLAACPPCLIPTLHAILFYTHMVFALFSLFILMKTGLPTCMNTSLPETEAFPGTAMKMRQQ